MASTGSGFAVACCACGLIVLAAGCFHREPAAPVAARSADGQVWRPTPLDDYPHLHNLLQETERIYSGGEPQGEESFADLTKLGVKTVVSVDGARPQVEAAKAHGLKYVHIPIGYDGVSDEAGKSLARLVREGEGPFYIHCHHGTHRGPAAAAVACIADGAADGKQALEVLQQAGTSKDYGGLWRDVENYQPPPADAKLPKLVEVAEVGSLAAAMAQVDRAKDNLDLSKAVQWSVPPDHPDLVPAQEALVLREALRETVRNLAGDFDDDFKLRLEEAEAAAVQLQTSLRDNRPSAASAHFDKLLNSCKACHAKYRN